MLAIKFPIEPCYGGSAMVEDLQSMVPLLMLSRSGTTVRLAAWPEAIHSQGEQYKPFRFMFVLGDEDQSTRWKRVEIHLEHAAIAAEFPAPFPGTDPIKATVQFVTERNQEDIIRQFDGVLTFDENKIFLQPVPKPLTR
jgi:hypothetical protein